MSDAYRISLRSLDGGPTAVASSGAYSVITDRPTSAGGRGLGFNGGQLLVFRPGDAIDLRADVRSRAMLLGGEPMDGPRHIFWNFVSSSRERMEQAKADWREGRFAPVPQETEFIPLPDDPPPNVRYP